MSGFDPTFDAAGTGTRDGSVPAPGAIDGRSFFLRADGTWATVGSVAPGPQPPAPGPDLDQWACNIAGYLTYEVSRLAVKFAVDWLPTSWIGDVVGGITVGLLHVILPEEALLFGGLDSAIFTWVSSYVSSHLVDVGAALLDDVAWAKLHCALYDKIKLTPTDLRAAILAFTAILGGLVGWTTPAIAAITYLFEHLGIADVGNIPITAFVRQYDCTTCATTGIGPAKPILQTGFDLTVTDDTTSGTFIDTLEVVGGGVTVAGSKATIRPAIGAEHNGILVGTERVIDFEDSDTTAWSLTDDSGGHRVQVSATVPTTTTTVLGVNKPDSLTLGITDGVYAVINGQLATVNLAAFGAFDVTSATGVTVSGLVVGNVYALQNYGGPYYLDAGTSEPDYNWQASIDGGATWANVVFAVMAHGPWNISTPVWATSAQMIDAGHGRLLFTATTTSVKLRIAETDTRADNHGAMFYQLMTVNYEPPSILLDHGGTAVATRPALNFVDGGGVTWSVADNSLDDRVDIGATLSGTSVSAVAVTAPLTTTGGTMPTIALTVPLAKQYGGTGIDTSAVDEGDLLVGTSAHTWVRGGIGGGAGISVTEVGGIFTIAASGTGGGGTGLSLLYTYTALGTENGITFTSIPGAYFMLLVVADVRLDTTLQNANLRFNGDTGSHYDGNLIDSRSAGVSDIEWTPSSTVLRIGTWAGTDFPADVSSQHHIWIANYAGTTFHKSAQFTESVKSGTAASSGNFQTWRGDGWWQSTAAITSIQLITPSGHFAAGSQFRVYALA